VRKLLSFEPPFLVELKKKIPLPELFDEIHYEGSEAVRAPKIAAGFVSRSLLLSFSLIKIVFEL